MNFLAPAFLAGLAAIAVPVLIHLINRERKVVVEFPSLMFLQRIPYRSVRRQKIRHLLLLIMRCVALALLVAAFARPFFDRRAAAASTTGAREVVILLDRSASMSYANRWDRAKSEAKKIGSALGAGDHATLVTFASDATVATEPMATPDRITASINATKLSAEGTRYAPAIKLASQILAASTLPRREVVIISDFQKAGWVNHNEVGVPAGTTVTPIDLGTVSSSDVGIAQVTSDRDSTGDRDKVTVAARVVNTSNAARGVTATLAIGGRDVQTRREQIPVGAKQIAFQPVVVPGVATRAQVRISSDSLPVDDAYGITIAPDEAVPVLVVEPSGARANQSLFLSRALAIGDRPSFRVSEKPVGELTPRDIDGRALVVLDEVAPPAGENGKRLRALVEGGGGVVMIPGAARTESWPSEWRPLLPATAGETIDRTADAGGTLSSIDYANPIFELFNAPRSGDFSTARFYRYRALAPQANSAIAARFDDGSPALVERVVGSGRVVMWASTIDAYWTNLPLQPVFLPFVHQLGKHVGRYADPRPSFIAGEVLDVSRHGEMTASFLAGRTADTTTELVLESPSGNRERITAAGANHLVTLREQGFYELRGPNTPVGSGRPIAVNVDPAESDLSHVDPQDVVLAITSVNAQHAVGDLAVGTPQDRESRQKVWWYLLLAALLLMGAETALSNRLSKVSA